MCNRLNYKVTDKYFNLFPCISIYFHVFQLISIYFNLKKLRNIYRGIKYGARLIEYRLNCHVNESARKITNQCQPTYFPDIPKEVNFLHPHGGNASG